jgi:hypothetical protein
MAQRATHVAGLRECPTEGLERDDCASCPPSTTRGAQLSDNIAALFVRAQTACNAQVTDTPGVTNCAGWWPCGDATPAKQDAYRTVAHQLCADLTAGSDRIQRRCTASGSIPMGDSTRVVCTSPATKRPTSLATSMS